MWYTSQAKIGTRNKVETLDVCKGTGARNKNKDNRARTRNKKQPMTDNNSKKNGNKINQ